VIPKPEIPCLTSSSLNGLMMASIFFILLAPLFNALLEVVGGFLMLTQVKPADLFILRDAQCKHLVNQLEKQKSDYKSVGYGGQHRECLNPQEGRIPEEETVCTVRV